MISISRQILESLKNHFAAMHFAMSLPEGNAPLQYFSKCYPVFPHLIFIMQNSHTISFALYVHAGDVYMSELSLCLFYL
jgi:hypothetical protein